MKHIVKWIGVCFVFILIINCKTKQKEYELQMLGYINYDTWDASDAYQPRKFTGKPKEILDSFFVGLEDTVLSSAGVLVRYHLTRYDSVGNLAFRRVFVDSESVSETETYYDDNGRQIKTQYYYRFPDSVNHSATVEIKSVRDKYNFFRATTPPSFLNEREIVETTSFLDNIRNDQVTDHNKLLITTASAYVGGLLDRTITTRLSEEGIEQGSYFRSSNGYLDSIVVTFNGKIIRRELFFNNEYGDPVLYKEIEEGKLINEVRFRYEYDTKGNWTKRLAYLGMAGSDPLRSIDLKNPGFELVKRNITY